MKPCLTCGSAAGCDCNLPTPLPCGVSDPCLDQRVEPPCPGGDCTVVRDPTTGKLVPAPGVCAPGPANVPLTDDQLHGSLGVCLQPAVDEARKIVHDLGLRGYRVYLVWQRRNAQQRFEVFRRVELHPVLVSSLAGVNWESSASGMRGEGEITLSEISPAQVDGRELFGEIPELNYILDPDIEFFYEVVPRARCTGQTVHPGRFTPSSLPYYDAENFQWVVDLVDQELPRSPPDDSDSTFQTARETLRKRRGRLRSSLRT